MTGESRHFQGKASMPMTKLNTRGNEQRFIHIFRQGWYLRTREGLKGPFENRSSAQILLDSIIGKDVAGSYILEFPIGDL